MSRKYSTVREKEGTLNIHGNFMIGEQKSK
jgi:hypothetical protein